MDKPISLARIFAVFTKIGAFTIGGGYMMVPAIQNEMSKRHWISDEELPDIVAIAQGAPGLLTVNMADSLALASRAIRVGSHGQTEEYERDSFSELPDNLPWTVLYRDRENLARSGAMHKESEEAHCRKEVENERLHRT